MAKPGKVPIPGVVSVKKLKGDSPEDTRLLKDMAQRANEYIRSFSWCRSVADMYFGDGIGGIIAAFLVRIQPARPQVDEWLWVIVGDIPPAYLVLDRSPSGLDALRTYIAEISRWVRYAKTGGRILEDVIPVNVPATPEWADKLDDRLRVLQTQVLPELLAARNFPN